MCSISFNINKKCIIYKKKYFIYLHLINVDCFSNYSIDGTMV